ncbi:DUF4184 family protein [Psychrobacter sp. FDAARGOS_221]|uniref:DUF4184 family protein n=1 Tax=Psychrobacter sp. FDAARGOS_221 TaxID=1975705 RepID=UPI000BB5921C|nr:DUF4184 family protein [Psychrobacter sp. FDAARGOS_221]PNK61148.1 DUF4184 domain-containing protein [Psychrobacter sp. FDAARGOS_221]
MPFTFSHPAIVLPLRKTKLFGYPLSLTGLIVGSLTPDFEYFLTMKIQSVYGHTVLGVLWFCLPLGLILCLLFQLLIKGPLIDNSPYWVQARLVTLRQFDWWPYFKRHWLMVGLSIIIGAYSHLLWDAFTHRHAFFTQQLALDRALFYLPVNDSAIGIYKVLQHASTVIGAGVIAVYFLRLPVHPIRYHPPSMRFWLSMALISLCIFGVRAYYGLSWHAYGNIIVSAIGATLFALTLVCGYRVLSDWLKN